MALRSGRARKSMVAASLMAAVMSSVGFAAADPSRSAGALPSNTDDLVGSVIELRGPNDARYEIQVVATGTTYFWAGTREPVATYVLTYTTDAQPVPQPLCTVGANEAILFGGDRYDAGTKTVTATGAAAAGWLNIACAGTALAKLHLTRHTEASQETATTAAERQAMLKMFTGDVCGDGTSFTVPGQPLLWADAKGLTSFTAAPASVEAVWSDRGAVCLDQFRLPEVAAAIAAHCKLPPPCSSVGAPAAGHVTSANP